MLQALGAATSLVCQSIHYTYGGCCVESDQTALDEQKGLLTNCGHAGLACGFIRRSQLPDLRVLYASDFRRASRIHQNSKQRPLPSVGMERVFSYATAGRDLTGSLSLRGDCAAMWRGD